MLALVAKHWNALAHSYRMQGIEAVLGVIPESYSGDVQHRGFRASQRMRKKSGTPAQKSSMWARLNRSRTLIGESRKRSWLGEGKPIADLRIVCLDGERPLGAFASRTLQE